MFKADIALADLAFDAAWKDGRLIVGQSQITPYAHAALETLLVCTEGQWFAVVRERLAESSPEPAATKIVNTEQFHQLYQACLMWPLDYLMIEVAQAGPRLRIRAGVIGSAPVYCRATDDRVQISWDFADFLAKPRALDLEIASHHLALHTAYSARQICTGVTLLTERASLYMEHGKARYQYPASAGVTEPSSLAEHGDAVAMFQDRLLDTLSIRPMQANRIVAELSGGMDSATVACALSALHAPVASMGILLDGDVGRTQIQRRRRITARLGLLDSTVEMAVFPPSLDLHPDMRRVDYPLREYYLEAVEALWNTARLQGHDLLFTGIGGDELFPVYGDEVKPESDCDEATVTVGRNHAEDLLTPRALDAARSLSVFDAPASPVPASALLAHACQAPNLLRLGFWPVNPLSQPGLVSFCHQLPREWRHEREIMRQYLHSCLGDAIFPRDYVKETFAEVLPKLISQHAKTIASQLHDCALADLGLVDQRAVLALLDQVAVTRSSALTSPLANFLWLERFVRRVI